MDEFALIRTIFNRPELTKAGGHLDQGIGDDCALISVPADDSPAQGCQLVQSIDTLVSDVHFPADGDPFLIGFRSLAVSVSDLAAMGANPHSFFLALTLPECHEPWLAAFSRGLAAMAKEARISLAGGDTTRGPLTITVHVQGFVPEDKALMRSGARPGDEIYVSGTLGDACGALPYILGERPVISSHEEVLVNRYWKPSPRIQLGQWLRDQGATSALDVSDGLIGDLKHILKASKCGADLHQASIPLSPALTATYEDQAFEKAIMGGDDYELCFTWPAGKIMPDDVPTPVTCIGTITEDSCLLIDGAPSTATGFTHF